jgi:uncharacterized repeat protein (TIGR02543 family)
MNWGDSFTPTGTITLFAKWNVQQQPEPYTVTFNANGATTGTPPTAQTVNAGSSITLPAGTGLSKTGFTFGGWNTNDAGTGTNYNAGDSFTPTGTIILYAKWNVQQQPEPYTVTFNANGGSGTVPDAKTVNAGSSITLPAGTGLSKTGFTFGGWNTNDAGTGTNYNAGDSFTPTGTVILYAKWNQMTPGTVAVTFTGFGDEAINLTVNTANNISKSQYQQIIVTINGDYNGYYEYFVDGSSQNWDWGSSFSVDAYDFSVGVHTLSVVVYRSGVPYSKKLTFRVVY